MCDLTSRNGTPKRDCQEKRTSPIAGNLWCYEKYVFSCQQNDIQGSRPDQSFACRENEKELLSTSKIDFCVRIEALKSRASTIVQFPIEALLDVVEALLDNMVAVHGKLDDSALAPIALPSNVRNISNRMKEKLQLRRQLVGSKVLEAMLAPSSSRSPSPLATMFASVQDAHGLHFRLLQGSPLFLPGILGPTPPTCGSPNLDHLSASALVSRLGRGWTSLDAFVQWIAAEPFAAISLARTLRTEGIPASEWPLTLASAPALASLCTSAPSSSGPSLGPVASPFVACSALALAGASRACCVLFGDPVVALRGTAAVCVSVAVSSLFVLQPKPQPQPQPQLQDHQVEACGHFDGDRCWAALGGADLLDDGLGLPSLSPPVLVLSSPSCALCTPPIAFSHAVLLDMPTFVSHADFPCATEDDLLDDDLLDDRLFADLDLFPLVGVTVAAPMAPPSTIPPAMAAAGLSRLPPFGWPASLPPVPSGLLFAPSGALGNSAEPLSLF
jgi:hypothetical protein